MCVRAVGAGNTPHHALFLHRVPIYDTDMAGRTARVGASDATTCVTGVVAVIGRVTRIRRNVLIETRARASE